MYPSRDMFISTLMNSFVLYVKRSIIWNDGINLHSDYDHVHVLIKI